MLLFKFMNSRCFYYLMLNVIINGWKLGVLCIKNVLLLFVLFQIIGLYNRCVLFYLEYKNIFILYVIKIIRIVIFVILICLIIDGSG